MIKGTLTNYVCWLQNMGAILTGSRAWNTQTLNSDWDFFMEFHLELLGQLIMEGFHDISYSGYDDVSVVKILRKNLGGSWIDVQLVKDVKHKKAAQDLLLRRYPKGLPRTGKRALWNDALKEVKSAWRIRGKDFKLLTEVMEDTRVNNDYPLSAVVEFPDGQIFWTIWTADGKWMIDEEDFSSKDLVRGYE